eukprot:gnl/MRDRNA2_/MRDRNA2_282075_c0_seq1.p1 gnl/MRDRNA2_/MRDRNA2_282075_c0~~gnl/MRDRNA2_/MRDRNA2_282075_c0_seq1.p1  ORF type:complete len:113 (+),score=16.53 gnl/MRDRNA2_/MRDRNA2_282075_c0_seq1:209-547(+)
MKASEIGKHWWRALELLSECLNVATTDTVTYSTTSSSCKKCNEQYHSLSLLKSMHLEVIQPSTVNYNDAISACERDVYWKLSLELLDECVQWASPNVISYNATVNICGKGAQ